MTHSYESQAAFSRAFNQLHGVTPSSARDEGIKLKAYPRLTFKFILQGAEAMDYGIAKKEAFDIIGFKRRMTEESNAHYHAIGQFWNDYFSQNWWGTLSKYYKYANGNDPNGTNPNTAYAYAVSQQDYNESIRGDSFYYVIGTLYNDKDYSEDRSKHSDELEIIHIPSGIYAVFTMPPNEEIGHYTNRIFNEWLPASGYQLTGGPELELSGSETDAIVWLPIKQ